MDISLSDILTYVAFAIILVSLGVGVGIVLRKKLLESSFEGAGKTADSIISGARKEADAIKKEAALQARDKLYELKQGFEKETEERRKETQALEKRLLGKEESLDRKSESFERKETDLHKREKQVVHQEKKVEEMEHGYNELLAEQRKRLEGLSGMSSEEAKKELLDIMEGEAKLEAARTLKRIEEETNAEADKKAKEIISTSIQRYAGDYVAERTVSVVDLPNDEMKGRIIGREGRNIRAIEAITGIDIIIDDTPEAVIISGHNPIRREIAKISIERLVADGRIHPARIEEVVSKVENEVARTIMEAGERAIFDTGLHGIHPEVQKLVGRLKFRSSYAQNVYAHSMEVAFICGIMAAELGLSTKQARRAGLLHDIGKAVDHEVEGSHAVIGGDLAKKYGESPRIVAAIAQHHDDHPESVLGVLIQAADTLSAARPGARREMLESYVKRLEDLERIARAFKGVEKSYAMQAGREIRIMVSGSSVNDDNAVVLSKDIARKIEKELSYPGQIKVTVIRETRAVDYAK
jgi:ribonuclease Y